MINFDLLKEKFNSAEIINDKIFVDNIFEVLEFLKMKKEFDFDMLTSIMAVDYADFIELNYKLYSTSRNDFLDVAIKVQNIAQSVIKLYASAYFDECEIFDLFGVKFEGNHELKRLYMPETWIGNPLLKSYKLEDKRLVWNE